MAQNSNNIIKVASGYGLVLGGVLVALSFIEYLLNLNLGWVGIFAFIVGVVYCTINYRDKYLGGYITYNRSLYFGVLISGFAYLIYGVYYFIYAKFINPLGYLEFFSQFAQIMRQSGVAEKYIVDPMSNPIIVAIGYFISGLLYGLIVSAITSIFTKKE